MEHLEAKSSSGAEGKSGGAMEAGRLTKPREPVQPGAAWQLGEQAQRLVNAQQPSGVAIRK